MGLTAKEKAEFSGSFIGVCADIEALIAYFDANNQTAHQDELTLRLNECLPKLEVLTKTFYVLYQDAADANKATLKTEYEAIKTSFFSIVPRIQHRIREISFNDGNSQPPPHPESNVRCPKISLPVFDGTTETWVKFRDLFESMVHHNAKMTPIEKFQYLQMSVKIPATQSNVLDNYAMTGDNYPDAWKALCDRYNDRRKILTAYTTAIFFVKKMQAESAIELRRVIDSFSSNINAMRHQGYALGEVDDLANLLIVNLLLLRLDDNTAREWKKHNNKDSFSYKELNDFLVTYWRSLDDNAINKKGPVKASESQHSPSIKSTKRSFNAQQKTDESRCILCPEAHALWSCKNFQTMTVSDRHSLVKSHHLCFNCLSARHTSANCTSKHRCKHCNGPHHSMLHFDKSPQAGQQSSQPQRAIMCPNVEPFKPFAPKPSDVSHSASAILSTSSTFLIKRQSLLATGLVGVRDADGEIQVRRALFDTGSDINVMTTECALGLGLELSSNHTTLTGIGERTSIVRYQTTATVTSRYGLFETKQNFLVMNQVTGKLPHHDVNMSNITIEKSHFLADPEFFRSAKVDLILNDELYYASMLNETKRLPDGPWMIHTKFGWIIGGSVSLPATANMSTIHTSAHASSRLSCFPMISRKTNDDLDKKLEKFFTMEEISTSRLLTPEEKYCEDLYAATTTRGSDGRYIVFMPLKENVNQLGMNLRSTLRQFYTEENARHNNEEKHRLTVDYVNEYLQSNHMQQVSPPNSHDQCYYMPQHGVVKMTSTTTKLRRVSNASSKSETGLSLNDVSCVGPVVQPDLYDILLRIREYQYILSGDISRMYLQIWIHESQRKFLRVVWRFNKDDPIAHYEMNTVTFGTGSAPYLATRTLVEIADSNSKIFPEASQVIKQYIYMDDLAVGFDSVPQGLKIRDELRCMLGEAGMELRKFQSNNPGLLAGLSSSDIEKASADNINTIKMLGVTLDAATDQYIYRFALKLDNLAPTKASVLSCIASLFDPLGWIGPVILLLKLFMKKLWLLKLDWNDVLPDNVRNEWFELYETLTFLDTVRVDRHCVITNHQVIELLGSADASEDAYGCVIHLRSIDKEGNIQVSLLTAKSKVAPKNQKTLARLELCAALMLARLVHKVLNILSKPIARVILWSDSTIVLSWIKMTPATLSTFVGNRVAEIQELTSTFSWNHIRSRDNPADVISRGLSAHDLLTCSLWWKGATFFSLSSSEWPESIITINPEEDSEVKKEMKRSHVVNQSDSLFQYIESRFSRPQILINVFASIKRFLHNSRISGDDKTQRISGPISNEEKDAAENFIVSIIQSHLFPTEYQVLLEQNKRKQTEGNDERFSFPPLSSKSPLASLTPFLDINQVIRVRGRLHNSPELTYDQKHPIILPQCRFTTALVKYLHLKYLHPGPKALAAFIRQKYWILRAKTTVKKINFECIRCFKVKPRDNEQLMADLPAARVTFTPPFTSTAIDYAGSYLIKSGYTRNAPLHKCYISLFKCMCTGAIHLELVSDLSTAAFLSAFSRFTSRRGLCSEIYSDNATCFEGADNELKRIVANMSADVVNYCLNEGISWKFTTPRASHAGGIYESGIKSMKHHLKRILTDASLTFEQFTTVIHKVEAVLNSRPLTPMTNDPADLRALTPGHFLIGRPLISAPERSLTELYTNRLTIWQRSQQLTQLFWKEWQSDYLLALQQRPKNFRTENMFSVGDMVLVKESNLPPMKWCLGRIVKLFPGKDRVIRNVQVKTATTTLERHVKYLCLLPIEDNSCSSRNAEY